MTTVLYRLRRAGRRGWFFGIVALGICLAGVYNASVAVASEVEPNTTIPGGSSVIYLPSIQHSSAAPLVEPLPLPCALLSDRVYEAIPVDGAATDHPDVHHGDLNLSLRGYVKIEAELNIVDVNGDADVEAPQLSGLFLDGRTPTFTSAHRVYDWNWNCGEHGCRSDSLTAAKVSLLGMGTTAGEAIAIPGRGPQIYGGGFKVLVLYAAEDRITLGYTRQDTVAPGYAVHIEQICVDPNLLALYRESNLKGRGELPALHNGEVLGTASGSEILVSVRDRGTFMDPRSRKDWWKGR
jgi:hypothetical protein